ncbi:hypothetical protein KI387_028975, partial [Taxus chinensis]
APKLLMQSNTYNCFALDIWSVGCIFVEMLLGKPLFCGNCPKEQLNIILGHVGGSSNEMIDKYWDALSDAGNDLTFQRDGTDLSPISRL